ncbi:MAG: hypothetical protein OHK0029_03830 [Armatimonadaceae bacterium]
MAMATDPVRQPEISDEALRFYREEGYLLLPGLISREAAETLRGEVMGIMEVIGLGKTKLRQTTEYLPGSALETFINSPHLLTVAATLMEGASTLYMPFTAVKSGTEPGEAVGGGEFHFHQDNQYTRFDGPGINLWVALTPMRQDNGCLRIVPRSHLNGTLASQQSPDGDSHKTVTYEVTESVPIQMEPGDCVAFSRLTLHGSGPNHTSEHRVAYAVQYHRDDVNFSVDGGQTWKHLKTNPRWRTGPVEKITPPQGKADGH